MVAMLCSRAARSAAEPYVIVVDGETVCVVRKPIKNLYVRLLPPDGRIQVSAPVRTGERRIVAVVRDHAAWIARQRSKMRRMREFGERQVDRGLIEWDESTQRKARAAIEAQLPELLERWEPRIGKRPTRIAIRLMTTRWGSCTPATGRIRLNLRLGLMDPRFLEYVLVHELMHLWVSGHGDEFRRRMDVALPQWRRLRRELNASGG